VFNHKGKAAQSSIINLATSLRVAEVRAFSRATVILEKNSTNEIRLKLKRGAPAGSASRAHSAEQAVQASRRDALVYSSKPQLINGLSSEKRVRQLPAQLSRYGGSTVKEGCAILERDYGKAVAFVTLTLPGGTDLAMSTLAKQSKGILDAFMQRVRMFFIECREVGYDNYLRSNKLLDKHILVRPPEIDYVGVWEPQKRGALHIHLAIGILDKKEYAGIKANIKRWWTQVLETYSKKTGIDLFEKKDGGTHRFAPQVTRTECKRVEKSVGRYMSKYMSKQSNVDRPGSVYRPSSWWFISRHLKAEVQRSRISLSRNLQNYENARSSVEQLAELCKVGADWSAHYTNPITGEVCGWIFYFPADEKQTIYEKLTEQIEQFHDPEENGYLMPEIEDLSEFHRGFYAQTG
jgi:hypothetical protein